MNPCTHSERIGSLREAEGSKARRQAKIDSMNRALSMLTGHRPGIVRLQVWMLLVVTVSLALGTVECLPANKTAYKLLPEINANGPYLGFIIPNPYELQPFIAPDVFTPNVHTPYVDLAGRRFYIGTIEGQKTIAVMCGLGMLNAGITTQQLFDFFDISGILHYGIAGGADDNLHVGDVSIASSWVHTGLWVWQRAGNDENDELPLESDGDYTRKYGALNFKTYNIQTKRPGDRVDHNLLNRVWLQPEEVFAVTGVPEVRDHLFYVPVTKRYLEVAKPLENLELQYCVNQTCLDPKPKVVIGLRGAAASVFVDNAAFRNFLHDKYKVSTLDMESSAIALVSVTNNIPYLIIRALSDSAGGNADPNQISTFGALAADNAVLVVRTFVKLLAQS
ncbi:hypothetical protein R1sor_024243 [Riccia sorocarpa]|uniref:Nucleoside phosphorylase domain-containing protein n=1 Tax=Riccia sorocarpa TaxID=122646 RepID=A0ABD3GPY9_9MARC